MSNNMNVEGSDNNVNLEYLMSLYAASTGQNLLNILMVSTLAKSEEEAIKILTSMGIPVLPEPDRQLSWNTDAAALDVLFSNHTAEVGTDIWDRYLDNLAEQKERIQEYLRSPQFRIKQQIKSPAFQAAVEKNKEAMALDSTSLNKLPTVDKIEEANKAGQLESVINGVTNYVAEKPDSGLRGFVFSLVISSVVTGELFLQPDTASTSMVGVKPIQDAAAISVAQLPNQLQEQANFAINLFATALIKFSNAEVIGNSIGGKPVSEKDAVLSFANKVVENVTNNEVNAFLMALFVSHLEKGQMTNAQMGDITRAVKMSMIAVALAALYKFEAGGMSQQEFSVLLKDPSMLTESEKKLLDSLTEPEKKLVEVFQELRAQGGEAWDSVAENLIAYCSSPSTSVAELVDPVKTWAKVGSSIMNPDING